MAAVPLKGGQAWESSHEDGKQLLQQPTLKKAGRLLCLCFDPMDGRRGQGSYGDMER